MGKIFTFDEIAGHKVPGVLDFKAAKTLTFNALAPLISEGEVLGAMVFGSVAKGTPSPRSDFDLLIITASEQTDKLLKPIFNDIYKHTNVAVEPIVVTEEFARNGWHTLDESFYLHFEQIPTDGNVIGENPLNIMEPFKDPLPDVHRHYLIQKIRRLTDSIHAYTEDDELKILQRALEAPVNTGRRTLQSLRYLGEISMYTPLDDNKSSVIEAFRQHFANTPLIEGFNAILAQDQAYSQLLFDTSRGDVTRQQYDSKLKSLIENVIPQAKSWEGQIIRAYMPLLEGNPTNPEGVFHSANNERI
jgi:hypothetical protein